MGTWGTGSFENDQALDWVADLDVEGASLLEECLSVDDNVEYLDAGVGCDAIAAAEVVAALMGRPAGNLPEELTAWVAGQRGKVDPDRFRSKALALLQAVLGAKSELNELWAENEEDCPTWRAGVEDLIGRLRG